VQRPLSSQNGRFLAGIDNGGGILERLRLGHGRRMPKPWKRMVRDIPERTQKLYVCFLDIYRNGDMGRPLSAERRPDC